MQVQFPDVVSELSCQMSKPVFKPFFMGFALIELTGPMHRMVSSYISDNHPQFYLFIDFAVEKTDKWPKWTVSGIISDIGQNEKSNYTRGSMCNDLLLCEATHRMHCCCHHRLLVKTNKFCLSQRQLRWLFMETPWVCFDGKHKWRISMWGVSVATW